MSASSVPESGDKNGKTSAAEALTGKTEDIMIYYFPTSYSSQKVRLQEIVTKILRYIDEM